MKSTYCIVDGVEKEIFKNPKTVCGMPKKSHRGLIMVESVTTPDNPVPHYVSRDKVTAAEEDSDANQLKTVFENGKIVKETSLEEIREVRKNAVHNALFTDD